MGGFMNKISESTARYTDIAPGSTSLVEKVRQLFRFPQIIVVAAILGLALTFPSIRAGFVSDDYIVLARIEGHPPVRSLLDYAVYLPRDYSNWLHAHLWWSTPGLMVESFRPSYALMKLDYLLFQDNPVGYHIHSMLWYLGLIAAWGLLLRRILPHPIGIIALLLFTVSYIHQEPVMWLSARYVLVSATPVILGLWAHIRWREDGWLPGLPLSIIGYIAGLMGGEQALGAMAYLVSYELFAGPGRIRQRLAALAPACALIIAYLAVYVRIGFGASGTDVYTNPFLRPLDYITTLPGRLILFLSSEFYGTLRPNGFIPQLVLVLLLAIIAAYVYKIILERMDSRLRRSLRWLAIGCLLALIPVSVSFFENRLLIASYLGGSTIVATVLYGTWKILRDTRYHVAVRLSLLSAAACLLLIHAVISPIKTFDSALSFDYIRSDKLALATHIDADDLPNKNIVVLVAPTTHNYKLFPFIRAHKGSPIPRKWITLSLAPYTQVVTRTGPRTIEVTVQDGHLLGAGPERVYRSSSSPPFAKGDVIAEDIYTVTILETSAAGPTRVAFEFDRSLDDPSLVFLAWQDQQERLGQLALPGVGESIEIVNKLVEW
jgi:hypothetical protein